MPNKFKQNAHKGGGGLKLDELNTQETISRKWSNLILTLSVFFVQKSAKKIH